MNRFITVGIGILLFFIFGYKSVSAASAEYVFNGDFEQGNTIWTNDENCSTSCISSVSPYSGSYGAWLGLAAYSRQAIRQRIALPGVTSKITFSYVYSYRSLDSFSLSTEFGGVYLVDVATSTIVWSDFLDPDTDASSGWYSMTSDITSLKGKTIDIVAVGNNDALYSSWLLLDEVSIIAEGLDDVAPNTSIYYTPQTPDGPNGSYRTTPSVRLEATDDGGSGLQTTYYSVDGSSFSQYSSPFILVDGNHTIRYYSIDRNGNTEITRSNSVIVDTQGAAVSINLTSATLSSGTWYKSSPTVLLTSSSGASGASNTIFFSIDGGSYQQYVGGFSIPSGTHTISAKAVEAGGYEGRINTTVVSVDDGAPTIKIDKTIYRDKGERAYIIVNGFVNDELSGLASVTVAGKPANYVKEKYFSNKVTLKKGKNIIAFEVIDQAGNKKKMEKIIDYRPGKVLGESVNVPIANSLSISIIKDSFGQNKMKKITIKGKNFDQSTQFKIGGKQVRQQKLISSKRIDGVLQWSKYKKGTYDLVAINSDGQSFTLKKAITIK